MGRARIGGSRVFISLLGRDVLASTDTLFTPHSLNSLIEGAKVIHYGGWIMKLTLLLLLASVGVYLLASFLLFLGLQALEMNQWQGAALGISMWTLLIQEP